MMNLVRMRERRRASGRQRGMGLIELMIAMFILAVGLVGVLGVILAAMTSNNRNKSDTGATFVAQMLIEQLGAARGASSIALTDCNGSGTARTFTLSPGGQTLYTSSPPAPTPSMIGTVDWTASSTAGYQTDWVMCDANIIPQTFDVRWNIQAMPNMSAQTFLITVGVRSKAAQTREIRRFAIPATLRLVITN